MKFYEEAFRECGDIFATRIPGLGDWVYICSPDLVKAMLEAPEDVVAGGDVGMGNLSHVLGEGSSTYLNGPDLKERRDVTSPYLAMQGSLRLVDFVRELALQSVAEWPLGQPFPLVKPLQKIALGALVKMIFDHAGPEKVRQLADIYENFSFRGLRSPTVSHPTLQIDVGPWSPWARVKKKQRAVFETFSREIELRLAALDKPEEDDLVLGMGRAKLRDGGTIPPQVMLAEILEMLVQGHELTGNSVTWTLGELFTHPEVLERLRQELDSVVGDGDVESSHLARLEYLEAVVNEGLRLRPSTPFTIVRLVRQPFSIGGYDLPPGTMIALCYPALARREDIFKNPQSFDPDNFYGKKLGPYDWHPFGGGSHRCPGRGLAEVVMKVAVATIARKVELKLAQDEVRPVRSAYFYEPNRGLLVTLEKRL